MTYSNERLQVYVEEGSVGFRSLYEMVYSNVGMIYM